MNSRDVYRCPGGCGFTLTHAYNTATGSSYQVCRSPACPLRVHCQRCRQPLEPVTDLTLVDVLKEPRSWCTNTQCPVFKELIPDPWPERYAA